MSYRIETPVAPPPPVQPGERKKRQKKPKPIPIPVFEIGWSDTVFKDEKSKLPLHIVLNGIVTYDRLKLLAEMSKRQTYLQVNAFSEREEYTEIAGWDSNHDLDADTCSVFGGALDVEGFGDVDISDESDFEEISATGLRSKLELDFDPDEDVEAMQNITWRYDKHLDAPSDLYKHDGEDEAHEELRLKDEHATLFDKPLTSFLAMMPLDFWRNVLIQTNVAAAKLVEQHPRKLLAGRKWTNMFSLSEVMMFLGMIIIMGIGKCGAYDSYWKGNGSMRVFMPRTYLLFGDFVNFYIGELGESFTDLMTLDRFRQLRASLTFHVHDVPADPLYRLRPLINLLRRTFMHYVIPGREISLDEACIACRSKYARHLIMYNAKKPSGKYHFRLYVTCCAKCWYVYAFKIHSKASREHEQDNEHKDNDSSSSEEESKVDASVLRQHVLDITKPFEGIYLRLIYYLYYVCF